jgi:hypothetical protein
VYDRNVTAESGTTDSSRNAMIRRVRRDISVEPDRSAR